MDGVFSRRIFVTFAFSLALGAVGCGSPVKSTKSPAPYYDASGGANNPITNPGVNDPASDVAGMFMKITSPTADITLHRADVQYADATNTRNDAGTGNFSTACQIATSGASATDRDLLCIAEVDELDLYFSEMTIQYSVPPSLCDYASFIPYHFYGMEPGTGPLTVSYEVDSVSGVTVDLPDANGDINSVNGLPVCDYDYTSIDGPNCCTGKYTLSVTTIDDAGNRSTSVSTGQEWGGKLANCLTGPAMTSEWSQYRGTTTNIPVHRLEYVEGTGLNSTFKITQAIDAQFGNVGLNSSLWAANFYNPTNHIGGVGTVYSGYDIRRPVGLRVPPTSTYMPQDTYKLTCLDQAEEVIARIRLMIREWNTKESVQEGGNSDIDSIAGSPNDPDFPDSRINDRLDWLDFGQMYPGTSL